MRDALKALCPIRARISIPLLRYDHKMMLFFALRRLDGAERQGRQKSLFCEKRRQKQVNSANKLFFWEKRRRKLRR